MFYAQENVAIEQLERRKEYETQQEESFKALESLLVEDSDELIKGNSQEVEKSKPIQAISPTTSAPLEIQPEVKPSLDKDPIRLANVAKFSLAIAALIGITYFAVRSTIPANLPPPDSKPVIKR